MRHQVVVSLFYVGTGQLSVPIPYVNHFHPLLEWTRTWNPAREGIVLLGPYGNCRPRQLRRLPIWTSPHSSQTGCVWATRTQWRTIKKALLHMYWSVKVDEKFDYPPQHSFLNCSVVLFPSHYQYWKRIFLPLTLIQPWPHPTPIISAAVVSGRRRRVCTWHRQQSWEPSRF